MERVQRAEEGSDERRQAQEDLTAELQKRRRHDEAIHHTVLNVLSDPVALFTIMPSLQNTLQAAPSPLVFKRDRDESMAAYANRVSNTAGAMSVVEHLTNARIAPNPAQPAAGQQAVADWDCLRGMVATWEAECGPMGEYGMKNSRLFANLCNSGLKPAAVRRAAMATCKGVG